MYELLHSHARTHTHTNTRTRTSLVLIIYVHRLRVCYGFNYCYYVVINYHSVGSQRVRVCLPRRMAVLQASDPVGIASV
jgi:hypothetical protein